MRRLPHLLWIVPLLLVVLLIALLTAVDTDAGRELARRNILRYLNEEVLLGKLGIEALEDLLAILARLDPKNPLFAEPRGPRGPAQPRVHAPGPEADARR